MLVRLMKGTFRDGHLIGQEEMEFIEMDSVPSYNEAVMFLDGSAGIVKSVIHCPNGLAFVRSEPLVQLVLKMKFKYLRKSREPAETMPF